MELYYFNDRKIPARIFLHTLHKEYVMIPPQDGIKIEIDIPEGKTLFIKHWETGIVLMSARDIL